ncbi:MAG: hypothetical protein HYR64_09265 [Fimbriimonas ginsengisoli]|uniref:Uncharacterized protein n=1 Tax=Fimbriimonas ginsengisoli TaxID=1005039 RepID=A0A931LTY2_FIMGI|nr:hypothetical protein [Fimbriimonas ginsengisoli]
MKRRDEDLLLKVAFGDATADEVARADGLSRDPEASRRLAELRRMREGLHLLREVPEAQISTERLRDALLRNGLKPERSGWGLGWVWMPAGALAATFLIASWVMRQSPTLVRSDAGPSAPVVLAKREPVSKPLPSAAQEQSPTVAVPTFVNESAPPSISSRRPGQAANRHGSGRAKRAAPLPSLDPGHSEEPFSSDAIVMIEPEADDATGAQRAVEMESGADVLVGG